MAAGQKQAKAAEAAGVARSSVLRWLATEEFQALVEEERENLNSVQNPTTLESLVPLAHAQLKDSLTGGSTLSAAQANIALSVLKAARTVENAGPGGAGSLANRLAELAEQGASD